MKAYHLSEKDLTGLLKSIMQSTRLLAPVARKNRFVFAQPERPGDVRLDYDTTILPPRKAFFPPRQELLRFGPNGVESAIEPRPQVLFGVHFYDVKAIDMLDELFRERNEDRNYLSVREATTIVASSIENISDRAFYAHVGAGVSPKGHDAFITKIGGGYVFEATNDKGEALAALTSLKAATDGQIKEAADVNGRALANCPNRLDYDSAMISGKARASFKNAALWKELSRDCFSCGTCNHVCPTCYCFDVEDVWNLDQKSGVRYRAWDGCLTEDFAKCSLGGGGACENFRKHKEERFRHRVMRKTTYLNGKLGGPACVGCGRCSSQCVPDIADPVKIIRKIMQEA